LLWVNLIQDTLGALALATDPPTLALLDRLPQPIGASLISFNMWKMIFGQSLLQLAITIVLSFSGSKIFASWPTDIVNTVVFNTFVWFQIFNEINCRRIDDKLNVFFGIQRNPFFIIIMTIIIAGQILIIFVGGAAFSVTRLNGLQWLVSILLGALSIPWGALVRLIPNEFLSGLIPRLPCSRRQKQEAVFVGAEPTPTECDETIVKVHDDRRSCGGKFSCLGNRDRSVKRPTPVPSDFPSSLSRASFDDKSPTIESRNDARADTPELPFYSVFNASKIAPALVVTSTTSPKRSRFESRRGLKPEELSTIEGMEVYGQSNPQPSVISVEANALVTTEERFTGVDVTGGQMRAQALVH
jgi:P-type Ca2+ transporter type 2C